MTTSVLAVKVLNKYSKTWEWLQETETGMTSEVWTDRELFHSRYTAENWRDHFKGLGRRAVLVKVTRKYTETSVAGEMQRDGGTK